MEEKYQQLEHREHIYTLPDTYIGSIEHTKQDVFIYNHESEVMELRNINYVPGFFKIFDEVLVNATDHRQRDASVRNIKITFEKGLKPITVMNDGNGIDICIHPSRGIYIPELLFAHLLTSTNYNQNEKRTTGGRNGYGVKVTGIFSEYLIIETVDVQRSLKYVQKMHSNNKVIDPPKVTKFSGKPYTKITFLPDYIKFGLNEGITDDIFSLLERRVYDTAAITPDDLSVYLNGSKLKFKSLEKYIQIWLPNDFKQKVFFIREERWNLGIVLSPTREFMQMSFVNGIWTMKGGRHVDYVLNQLIDKIKSNLSKNTRTKNKVIKPSQIRENIWIFLDCTIENPAFTSQTKEEMSTKVSQFGSCFQIDEKVVDKFLNYKSSDADSFMERIMEKDRENLDKQMKKSDGTKKSIIKGISKLEDAFLAGTKYSGKCTLILTEGDSAKSSVISGLSVFGTKFRDTYGIFPLRGKFINVRDTGSDKVSQNEEVKNIKTILGLQQGKVYTEDNIKELRYGSIAITTDQDSDGSHIKGLLLNFLHFYWPSLLKIDGFVKAYITPIVKGFNGNQTTMFYTLKDYEQFKNNLISTDKWTFKYYKGLGTSSAKEFKEYFKNLSDITVKYKWDTDKDLIMAFSKTMANKRKEWLQNYNPDDTIDYISSQDMKTVQLSSFIHKDLKHFSNYDNYRSIPNIMDGLKPSQRKVLYGIQQKIGTKLQSEIKVAQLASYVSEQTHYHHGEVSLEQTIIGMAQDFMGKNNLPLLRPIGQFGSILHGGKDHAQSRYIFTSLMKYTNTIFCDKDSHLLQYNIDEDKKIEPELYYPIIPMVLINGSDGIGTGYSSSVPCFDTSEIIESIMQKNMGKDFKDQWKPFYKGFKGVIDYSEDPLKFLVRSKYSIDEKENTLYIYELPIGVWTQTYKDFLDVQQNLGTLTYVDKSTDIDVHFEIKLQKKYSIDEIEKTFKLNGKIYLTNMYLYNENREIQKFQSVREILEYFYQKRLVMYIKRKELILQKYTEQLETLTEKMKFISLILEDPYIIFRKTRDVIKKTLLEKGFTKLDTLLSISISQWTDEKIYNLSEEIGEIEEKKTELESKTPESLWNDDLEYLKLMI